MQPFLLPSYNFFDIQIRSFIIISYQFSLFFQCKCKEKTGCQDPERLPDEKRRSFKQELLSATIEFILLSKERTGNVC